jgi:hypothetical protein
LNGSTRYKRALAGVDGCTINLKSAIKQVGPANIACKRQMALMKIVLQIQLVAHHF